MMEIGSFTDTMKMNDLKYIVDMMKLIIDTHPTLDRWQNTVTAFPTGLVTLRTVYTPSYTTADNRWVLWKSEGTHRAEHTV